MKFRYLALGIFAGATMMVTSHTEKVHAENTKTNVSAIYKSAELGSKGWKVEVENWQELRDALSDEYVSDITLSTDLQLESTVVIAGLEKHLHGNGHTLNAQGYQLHFNKDNSIGSMDEIIVKNTDIYGLMWSSNNDVQVTYDNVEHAGKQLIYLPNGKLILKGNVVSHSEAEETFQGKELEISPFAKVDFSNTSNSLSPISMNYDQAKMTIGNSAELIVRAQAMGIQGGTNFSLINYGSLNIVSEKSQGIHLGSKSQMNFESGSKTNVIGNSTVEEALEATNGSIFVRDGANLVVESRGVQGTIIAGDQLVFEEGSSFSITNHNTNGSVMGSYATPVKVQLNSSKGIETWTLGNSEVEQPDQIYQSVSSSFKLSGYLSSVVQSELQSNNEEFTNTYKTGRTSKIIGGSYVK